VFAFIYFCRYGSWWSIEENHSEVVRAGSVDEPLTFTDSDCLCWLCLEKAVLYKDYGAFWALCPKIL